MNSIVVALTTLLVMVGARTIDESDCNILNGAYGAYIECELGYVGTALCGSGTQEDCSGYSHQIRCCRDVDYTPGQENEQKFCNWFPGEYGANLFCENNFVMYGICGSGRREDCTAMSHALYCCDDHSLTVVDNCFWIWGDYGVFTQCPENTVGMGYCNGGGDRDCNNGTSSHGIYCCQYS